MQYIETFISHLNINTVDITINFCYNHLYYITKDILEEYSMSEIKTIVPPIKCQGIKTKLVPFIKDNIIRNPNGTWIEPFVGTGVVAFNLAPQRAFLLDKNQYIIKPELFIKH